MTECWKNKYAVKFDDPVDDIPVGTMFTITGIEGNQFELAAMDEQSGYAKVIIDLDVLLFGFTCGGEVFEQSFVPGYPLLDQISDYVRKKSQ